MSTNTLILTPEHRVEDAVTGLMAGTNVLTMTGYVDIKDLNPGDRIITRSGARNLRALTSKTVQMRPIRIGKGAPGFTREDADMLIAPDTPLMVRDWRAKQIFGCDQVVMPATRMTDDAFIAQIEVPGDYEVFDLHFEDEEIFYADGLEIVSQPSDANGVTLAA